MISIFYNIVILPNQICIVKSKILFISNLPSPSRLYKMNNPIIPPKNSAAVKKGSEYWMMVKSYHNRYKDEGSEFKLYEGKATSTELQGVEEIIWTYTGEGFGGKVTK